MTLVVLALDALDAKLVGYFGADAYRLERSKEIGTYSYMYDHPYTLEVWPTVATGLGPKEHGITGSGTSEWSNPVIDFASRFTGGLSAATRNRLGNLVERFTNDRYSIACTDAETLFDSPGRAVHNWPGVYRNRYLLDVWRTLNPGEKGQSVSEFEQQVYGIAAEQFGWANEMLNHGLQLAAVHVHTLDMCGHVYSDDEERYEKVYRRVAEMVSELRESLGDGDDLLLLSDHGMGTEWIDGKENAGTHTSRAMAATTVDEPLFDDVFGVREWVEANVKPWTERESEEIEYNEQHLRDLGYI